MRKIEREMLEAIYSKANWYKANMIVEYIPEVNSSAIRLHGNHIATFVHYSGDVVVNKETFKEWPTTTTRSRLRALGVAASIKGGRALINLKEVA